MNCVEPFNCFLNERRSEKYQRSANRLRIVFLGSIPNLTATSYVLLNHFRTGQCSFAHSSTLSIPSMHHSAIPRDLRPMLLKSIQRQVSVIAKVHAPCIHRPNRIQLLVPLARRKCLSPKSRSPQWGWNHTNASIIHTRQKAGV